MSFNKLQSINAIDIALGGLGQSVNEIQALDDIASRVGNGPLSSVQGGLYLPVASSLTNLTTVTPKNSQFSRVFKTVTVSGQFNYLALAGSWAFILSLPIPSVFVATENLGGTFITDQPGGLVVQMRGVVGGGSLIQGIAPVGPVASIASFIFAYTILP